MAFFASSSEISLPETAARLCSCVMAPSRPRLHYFEEDSRNLFIHELSWILALPDDYITTALEGNVTIDRSTLATGGRARPASPGNVIHLKKELVRGEHPAVELYYERRGLDD